MTKRNGEDIEREILEDEKTERITKRLENVTDRLEEAVKTLEDQNGEDKSEA